MTSSPADEVGFRFPEGLLAQDLRVQLGGGGGNHWATIRVAVMIGPVIALRAFLARYSDVAAGQPLDLRPRSHYFPRAVLMTVGESRVVEDMMLVQSLRFVAALSLPGDTPANNTLANSEHADTVPPTVVTPLRGGHAAALLQLFVEQFGGWFHVSCREPNTPEMSWCVQLCCYPGPRSFRVNDSDLLVAVKQVINSGLQALREDVALARDASQLRRLAHWATVFAEVLRDARQRGVPLAIGLAELPERSRLISLD